jgi:hypothetical protein
MVGRAAEVDLPRGGSGCDVERAFDLVRDAERADEVSARAAVHDRELDVIDARNPVHDLVHGAVPAHGDDQARASGRRVVCQLSQVLRAL